MVPILLWIAGFYVLAAIAATILVKRRVKRKANEPGKHYILMADNQASRMEWYLRTLHGASRRMGTDVKITIVDCASDDETMDIAEMYARQEPYIRVCRPEELRSRWLESEREGAAMAAAYDAWVTPYDWRMKPERAEDVLWILHAEGIVEDKDYPVIVDLRQSEELQKIDL